MEQQWYPTSVAQILKVQAQTVHAWIKRGNLAAEVVEGSRVITATALIEFFSAGGLLGVDPSEFQNGTNQELLDRNRAGLFEVLNDLLTGQDEFLKLRQAVPLLNVDISSLRRWIHWQTLEALTLPKGYLDMRAAYRVLRSTVESLIPEEGLLTVSQVADYLRVDPTAVYGWIHQGALEAVAIRKTARSTIYRVRQETLVALINNLPQNP